MNKEFVPYEPSLALKEIGFNEPCFRFFYSDCRISNNLENDTIAKDFINSSLNSFSELFSCSAPTYSQAFRWFREKHRLQPSVNSFCFEEYSFIIMDNRNEILYPIQYKLLDDGKKNPWEFDTYEEAELACLIKLIEIVKGK